MFDRLGQTDKDKNNQLPREDGDMWNENVTDRQTFRIMEMELLLASCRARVGVV